MTKKIAIIGASLGGMVAAAELKNQGYDITIYEKNKSIGGLYNKVDTPFGSQELGMHVIYANNYHYNHLCDIFGKNAFSVLSGINVDKGASTYLGCTYFKSHYPNFLNHPLRDQILNEICSNLDSKKNIDIADNAYDEIIRRFGIEGSKLIIPIIEKLWNISAKKLSPYALHCFFDLRRLIVAPKNEADILKEDVFLDNIIANPEQDFPKGEVFGGRIGLVFCSNGNDLIENSLNWAQKIGVKIKFSTNVILDINGELKVDDDSLKEFDACIVSLPIQNIVNSKDLSENNVDKLSLSIYYYSLKQSLENKFPSYYMLVHDPKYLSSRIVNYGSYQLKKQTNQNNIISVESIHKDENQPSVDQIKKELLEIIPNIEIKDSYRLPKSLSIYAPSLKNKNVFDDIQKIISQKFGKPIYFAGMRTDTGVFFSHQTIGLAHECALDCIRKLS